MKGNCPGHEEIHPTFRASWTDAITTAVRSCDPARGARGLAELPEVVRWRRACVPGWARWA